MLIVGSTWGKAAETELRRQRQGEQLHFSSQCSVINHYSGGTTDDELIGSVYHYERASILYYY